MKRGIRARHDMNYKPERKDTYQNVGKWSEPTVCTDCGAVYHGGRWAWKEAPSGAAKAVCPACQRIRENYPAGTLEMTGEFFLLHREEIISLVRHEEEAEKKNHPLERLIAVKEDGGRTTVTTTGVHLARRIGEALSRAYQGELSVQYGDSERSIRVSWSR